MTYPQHVLHTTSIGTCLLIHSIPLEVLQNLAVSIISDLTKIRIQLLSESQNNTFMIIGDLAKI